RRLRRLPLAVPRPHPVHDHRAVHPDVPGRAVPAAAVPDLRQHRHHLRRAAGGHPHGLNITYLNFSLPFSIWMLAGYFDGIPRELDQAGKVDGAGNLTILLRIILPAARPGIVAVAIYAFMTAWGEVLFASVLTTEETRTLAVGLRQ